MQLYSIIKLIFLFSFVFWIGLSVHFISKTYEKHDVVTIGELKAMVFRNVEEQMLTGINNTLDIVDYVLDDSQKAMKNMEAMGEAVNEYSIEDLEQSLLQEHSSACQHKVVVGCGALEAHNLDTANRPPGCLSKPSAAAAAVVNSFLVSKKQWTICADAFLSHQVESDVEHVRHQCDGVLSIGVGNDWMFDAALAEHYGCNVASFDHTVQHPSALAPGVRFRSMKLEPSMLHTFAEQYAALLPAASSRITILKFGCDGCGWPTLREMAASEDEGLAFFGKVDQILLEEGANGISNDELRALEKIATMHQFVPFHVELVETSQCERSSRKLEKPRANTGCLRISLIRQAAVRKIG